MLDGSKSIGFVRRDGSAPIRQGQAYACDVEYTVGMAMVRAFLASVSELGLDVADIARETALDVSALENPDARVPELQIVRLFVAGERRWSGELFGLHAGSSRHPQGFEVLEHVASVAPTVGESFRRLARYFSIVSNGMGFKIDDTGADEVVLSMTHPYALALLPKGFVEYLWTVVVTRMSRYTSQRVRTTVAFRHSPQGDLETYRRMLGAVVFGAAEPGLRIPRDQWNNVKNDSADAARLSTLEREAHEQAARMPRPIQLLDRVRTAIAESLRGGDVGIGDTARRAGLSVRSLQRALAAEGYTHTQVLDEVRHVLAVAYLSSTIPSLSEVAYMLGFSEPSAFHRAFRRWTGKTPLESRTGSWQALESANSKFSTEALALMLGEARRLGAPRPSNEDPSKGSSKEPS
jgi:AraC-like DNA-binding protein